MKQRDFIRRLENGIRPLPYEEQREIVADYEEHFARGLEEEKTEEEICESLGNPEAIAREYLQEEGQKTNSYGDYSAQQAPSNASNSSSGSYSYTGKRTYSNLNGNNNGSGNFSNANSSSGSYSGSYSNANNGSGTHYSGPNNSGSNGPGTSSGNYSGRRTSSYSGGTPNWLKALIAIAIIMLNILCVLPIWLSGIGILLTFIAVSIVLIVVGIALLAATFIYFAVGFAGIALVCMGILALIGSGYLCKYFINATAWYYRLNVKLLREGSL